MAILFSLTMLVIMTKGVFNMRSEFFPVEKWEVLMTKTCHYYDEESTPFTAICVKVGILYLLKTHTLMGKTLPLFPLPGIFWKILLQDIPSALLSLRYLYSCHLMETFPKHLTQELPICAFP